MPSADPDLKQISTALRHQFPGLEPVDPLHSVGHGFGSIVVETDSGFVFRLARNAIIAERQHRERELLRRIRPHIQRFALPDPEYQIAADAAVPYGGVGYRRLAGTPLRPSDITASNRDYLAIQLADFIHQLQRIPLELVADLELPQFPPSPEKLKRMWLQISSFLEEIFSLHEYRALAAWWGDAVQEWQLPVQQPVLVHGDLWYGNIPVDAERQAILGILGFENAAIGDAVSDLAPQRYLGGEFLQAVVDAFQTPGYLSVAII